MGSPQPLLLLPLVLSDSVDEWSPELEHETRVPTVSHVTHEIYCPMISYDHPCILMPAFNMIHHVKLVALTAIELSSFRSSTSSRPGCCVCKQLWRYSISSTTKTPAQWQCQKNRNQIEKGKRHANDNHSNILHGTTSHGTLVFLCCQHHPFHGVLPWTPIYTLTIEAKSITLAPRITT